MNTTDQPERLESWKQIAAYLGKSERTVRRWQQVEGLPVHRHQHQQRGSVWAFPQELDAWLDSRRRSPEPLPETPEPSKWRLGIIAPLAAFSLVLVAAFIWSTRPSSPFFLEATPITALQGPAYGPTFSPDGRQVAFFWAGTPTTGGGVFVKEIGSEQIRQVASGLLGPIKGFTYSPAWSPDGKTIAFLRRVVRPAKTPGGPTDSATWLFVVSPDGGPERSILQLTEAVLLGGNHLHLSWSADSQSIVAPMAMPGRRGIHRISIATAEAIQLTRSPTVDYGSRLSADGRAIVFLRKEGPDLAPIESLMRLEIDPKGVPVGQPQTLYKGRSLTAGVDWTSNGEDLIVCQSTGGYYGPLNSRLFRLRARPGSPLQPLPVEANDCSTVAVSRPGPNGTFSLLFANNPGSKSGNAGMWQLPLPSLQVRKEYAPSSRADLAPSFSPDGSMIAFRSNRRGHMEVWIANRDGTGARPLTSQRAVWSQPVWSPDGDRLLFGAPSYLGKSPYGLYLVPVAGGRSTQVPTGADQPFDPFWSSDGRHIYYWTNTNATQLWRIRLDGTGRTHIGDFPANTRQRGVEAGGFIYYTRYRAGLARIALSDGKEEALASMSNSYFAITKKNLFFVRSGDDMLCALPVGGGPLREFGPVHELNGVNHNVNGFSVDEQESTLLWSEAARPQLDLMIVRDFR